MEPKRCAHSSSTVMLSFRCWIPDAVLQRWLNIGYYGVVFIFTFIIFIVTVRQIVLLKPTADTAEKQCSIKTNSFSILGLLLMLGITWAFAFFSHGPLVLASYYIFTILNSFQGRSTTLLQQFQSFFIDNNVCYAANPFRFLQVSFSSSTITIPARRQLQMKKGAAQPQTQF